MFIQVSQRVKIFKDICKKICKDNVNWAYSTCEYLKILFNNKSEVTPI